MRVLITGAAGFVGSYIARLLHATDRHISLVGIDNFSRIGSRTNLSTLEKLGVKFFEGDISVQKDVELLPQVDWIIDCAANPSVLAGVKGSDTLGLINSNLTGTFYLLEKCKRDRAGFILISTNRVYSVPALNSIELEEVATRFDYKSAGSAFGVSNKGVTEHFSTSAPISLYGATKLASEILALEYHHAFEFPVWINRCGVIAGPGQFGKIDQGIFSYWVYQYLLQKPLSFIGFGGKGKQVRDMLHPEDLFRVIQQQMFSKTNAEERIFNLGGGVVNTMSLLELDQVCKLCIEKDKTIASNDSQRLYDIPYYATDFRLAQRVWGWTPKIQKDEIIQQVIQFGTDNKEHIMALN